MKINLVGGRGKYTRTFLPWLRGAGHRVVVTGRETDITPAEAAKECDLTIVSVWIPSTREVIKEVAPHAKAIMDFTSVKHFPMQWMTKYANSKAEICGAHPNWGRVKTIDGKVMFYCPTSRTGDKCMEVLHGFEKAGVELVLIDPDVHDIVVNGYSTFARYVSTTAYMRFLDEGLRKYGISLPEFYNKYASTLTRPLIAACARQAGVELDKVYASTRRYNPFAVQIAEDLLRATESVAGGSIQNKGVRAAFGRKSLRRAQEGMTKIINITPRRI